MKIIKKVLLFILIILFFILFIFAIIEKDDTHEENKANTIIYSINSIPYNFQSESNLTKRQQDIICAISKGLVSRNNKGDIVPELAESYSVSDDGIEYIFKIKKNIKWSNGVAITTKDICDFFKVLIKNSNLEDISALMNVYGVKDYKESQISFEDGVAITECDNNSIKFRLNSADNDFINELAKVQYRIKQSFVLWNNLNEYYDEIAYSGDYKISEFTINSIKLESASKKNKYIEFVCDTNNETAMASFELGKRDIVVNPPYTTLNDLSKRGKLMTFPSNNESYIAFNSNNKRLDLNTRKTLYKLINKSLEDFQSDNINLFELSEGSYYRSEKEDLTKMQNRKVIINSASDDINVKVISLCSIDIDSNRLLCDYLVNWFKEEKDITINYELLSTDEFYKNKLYKNYDMALINGEYESNTLKNLFYSLDSYLSEDELNNYNKLNKDNDNYNINLEELLFNNFNVLPLYYLNNNICVSEKRNVVFDYYNNIDFSKIMSTN